MMKLLYSAVFALLCTCVSIAQAQTPIKAMETAGVKIGDTPAEMELALKSQGYDFVRKSMHKAGMGLPERIATAHYKKDGRNLEPDFLMVVFGPVSSKVLAISRSERFNVETPVLELVKTMSAKYGAPTTVRGTTNAVWVERRAEDRGAALSQCEAFGGLQLSYLAAIDTYAGCKRSIHLAMSAGDSAKIVRRMTINLVDFESLYEESKQLKNDGK